MDAIEHLELASRFRIRCGDEDAVLTYLLSEETITFTYTYVPEKLRGRSMGNQLVKTGLQFAEDNNLKVESTCWFVSKYLNEQEKLAS